MLILYIALGGALGATARYSLGLWIHSWAGSAFPWGPFVVNTIGSFLLGFILRYLEGTAATPELRAMLTIGILGAFTTFSTFTYETVVLIQAGDWTRAALYSVGSLLLGLLAISGGLFLAAQVL
jgi:CrcB protein